MSAASLLLAAAALAAALDPRSAERLRRFDGRQLPNATLKERPGAPEIFAAREDDGGFVLTERAEKNGEPRPQGGMTVTQRERSSRRFSASADGALRRVLFQEDVSWESVEELAAGPETDKVAAALGDQIAAAWNASSLVEVLAQAKGTEGIYKFFARSSASAGVSPVSATGDAALVSRFGSDAYRISVGDAQKHEGAPGESQLTQESTECFVGPGGAGLAAVHTIAKHYGHIARDGAPTPDEARYFEALLRAYLEAAAP